MVWRIFSSYTNKKTKLSSTVKTDGITSGTTLAGLHGRLHAVEGRMGEEGCPEGHEFFFPMLVIFLIESQVKGPTLGVCFIEVSIL